MTDKSHQNYINHVALVLDGSGSMGHLKNDVIRVADAQIAHLAQRSKELGQETRVTVYVFDNEVKCVVYDKDVLRLPSLAGHYYIRGMTALIDATIMSQDDLDMTPEKYGDHAFLTFVLTDGAENASKLYGTGQGAINALKTRLDTLKDNRTVAVLVPDAHSVFEAKQLGFPAGNIQVWDTTSVRGLEEAVESIKTATDTFMQSRTTGLRGTKTLFTGAQIDDKAIKAANLTPLPHKARKIIRVTKTEDAFEKVVKPANTRRKVPEMGTFVEIEKFVRRVNGGSYKVGQGFYELVKSEVIQGDKEIAVVEINTNQVYVGDGARQLLGLPDTRQRVKPDLNPNYKIFVQSSSLNRHLPLGSEVLLLTA